MNELPTQLFPRPLGRIVGDYDDRMQWHYEPTPLDLPPPPAPPGEETHKAPAAPSRRLEALVWFGIALFVVYAWLTA